MTTAWGIAFHWRAIAPDFSRDIASKIPWMFFEAP
jgi:hypothetical protein